MTQPIRILIADDHPAFRSGVRSRLEQESDFEIIGEASNGREAFIMAQSQQPNVLLLDMEMPQMSGLEVTEQLHQKNPDINILILSAYEDEDYIFGVLDSGACGYLTKQEPLPTIIEAIRGVANGETGWLSRRISALFVNRRQRKNKSAQSLLENVSDREVEVLQLVAQGQTNQQIADQLFISESTVKKHVNSLYEKIGLTTRAQLVAWAWKNGVVANA